MTFAEEVTADAPELWWDTREAVGTAQPDASGNGHTGTIVGAPTADADGLTFDASIDQHIEGDDTFGPTTIAEWALEVVVNFITAATYAHVAGFLGTGDDALLSGLDTVSGDVVLAGQWFDTSSHRSWQSGITDPFTDTGVLHHLVVEYDGANVDVYLDGVLYDTQAIAGPGAIFASAEAFYLGNDQFGIGDGTDGLIRHGIFYDHALGPTRVAAHATAALSDDPPPGEEPPEGDSTAPSSFRLFAELPGSPDLSQYGEEPAFTIMRGSSSLVTTGFVADAGTLSCLLTNINRDLDPNNLAGPFVTAGVSDLVPGVDVEAFVFRGLTGYPVFAGSADGWPQTYPLDGTDQVVDFRATDIFRLLANAQLTLKRPSEYSGARIQAILDDFGYAGPTDIAHGNAIISPLRFTTVSALSHIADVVMAEWGEFYVAADGTLVFRDRDTIASDVRSSVSQATFVQSGGLNFIDVTMKSATVADIINECVVVWSDTGKQVTVRDEVSIAMPWSKGIPNSIQVSLPLSNAAQARAYARWIVQRYAYPRDTFTSVTLEPGNEPAGFDLWEQCLTRELGDLITVTLDPLSAPYTLSGDPITRECWIRGIQHDFAAAKPNTTFYLQDASWRADRWRWDVSEWDGGDVWGL